MVRRPDFKRGLISHWMILVFQIKYTLYQNLKKTKNKKKRNTLYPILGIKILYT